MDDSTSAAILEVAGTIQSASVRSHPSAAHDLNPSTAASTRMPVVPVQHHGSNSIEADILDALDEDEDHDVDDDDDDDDISLSLLKPLPRSDSHRPALPPLPDLRFEQSYLASIGKAKGWSGVVWITVRDQVLLAFTQGFLMSLAVAGWKHWNSTANTGGASVGARIRRWWYEVNNWPLKGTLADEKLAAKMGNYYKHRNSGGD